MVDVSMILGGAVPVQWKEVDLSLMTWPTCLRTRPSAAGAVGSWTCEAEVQAWIAHRQRGTLTIVDQAADHEVKVAASPSLASYDLWPTGRRKIAPIDRQRPRRFEARRMVSVFPYLAILASCLRMPKQIPSTSQRTPQSGGEADLASPRSSLPIWTH